MVGVVDEECRRRRYGGAFVPVGQHDGLQGAGSGRPGWSSPSAARNRDLVAAPTLRRTRQFSALRVLGTPKSVALLIVVSPRLTQTRRRSVAHRLSWWRLVSCSLRNTADAWVSTVFTEMVSWRAISL